MPTENVTEVEQDIVHVVFGRYNPNWNRDLEFNILFLRQIQNHANHLLQIRGHLFLNELFDMLGIDRTRFGVINGWLVGQKPNQIALRVIGEVDDELILEIAVQGEIYNKI